MRHSETSHPGRIASGLSALVLLLAALAVTTPGGELARDGRNAQDLAMEDFLLHAEVIQIKDVGEGITKPKRLTLKRGDQERRAIFKTIDSVLDGTVITDRVEQGFSDRYAYEVAAYRLDRLAGIGLVPVTVVRTVNGKTGSVQLWIEDVITFEKAVNESSREVQNFDLLVERLGLMYVLDSLIYNVDRNFGNILVNLDKDVFHPIDHSRAFRLDEKPPPSTRGKTDSLSVPNAVAERLRAMDRETLDDLVGDLLEKAQVRAILKRRDKLVKMIERSA